MLKYGDFLLEKVVYDLILESKIEFSKSFLNILASLKHPLAKDIIQLQSQDKDVAFNYIDVDLKQNDTLTFIQDKRAQAMTKDKEDLYKITDANKHLKINDFKTDEGRNQNTEIYQQLGLNIEEAKRAVNGSQVKIIKKMVSPYDSNKVYVSYQGATDPSIQGVINIDGIVADDEIYKQLWTTNRNPLKIGRFITAILPLTGKTITDTEKEKFVTEFKSVLGVINDAFAKFGVVEGRELLHFYQGDNYYRQSGTLGNSCMAGASDDMLAIYSENPHVCKMVVKWSDEGKVVDGKYRSDKIVGRALLWKTTSGDMFMDRIYTIDSSDEELFKKYAEMNGWWCKKTQNSSNTFTAQRGTETKSPIYVVQLSYGYEDEYPYLDTLCFLNDDTGKLSNSLSQINANKKLNDTGGGYDRIYDDDEDED